MSTPPRPAAIRRALLLHRLLPWRLTGGLATVLLGACTHAPPGPPAATPMPRAWKATADASDAAVLPADGAWWTLFGDPLLDALVTRAARQAPRIDEAAARLAQARALVQAAAAQRQPQAGALFSAGRQGGPLVNAAGSSGTLLTAGASVAWEADLFGRGVDAEHAAALDAGVRQAQLRAAVLAVQADTAQTVLALRAADAERALARQHLQAWRATLQVAEERLRLGGVAELAVLRLRAEAQGAQATLQALDRQRALLEHALAVLAGEPATSFSVPESPAPASALPRVPAGLPSELLQRRPDLVAAAQALAAAQARAGLARNSWFPTLALTASGGQASGALAQLLQASTRAFGVSALLSLPLLDGGRRDAGIAQAQAEADVAAAAQRGQVLQALREVEDQLATLHLLHDEVASQSAAADAAQRAAALAESRWQHGLSSQTDSLDLRRTGLAARRQLLQLQAAQAQATVALIRALGGGWPAVAVAGG